MYSGNFRGIFERRHKNLIIYYQVQTTREDGEASSALFWKLKMPSLRGFMGKLHIKNAVLGVAR